MQRQESLNILQAIHKQMDALSNEELFDYMMKHSPTFIADNIQEVQKHIMKYRSILEKEPDNFSVRLTLDSLERHKKDLEGQLKRMTVEIS